MREDLGFWVAVMLMAVAGVALFKLAAASPVGDKLPGVRDLANYI